MKPLDRSSAARIAFKGYWVARDECGDLYFYEKKPVKTDWRFYPKAGIMDMESFKYWSLPKSWFPEIKPGQCVRIK